MFFTYICVHVCMCTDPKSRLKKWSGVCEAVRNFSTGCYCTGFGIAAIHIYSQANKEAFRKRGWLCETKSNSGIGCSPDPISPTMGSALHETTIFTVIAILY